MRFFGALVAVVFLLSTVFPNVAEGTWVRARPGQVTPQFWVDTSRYVTREIVVSPARTIPAVTERRWVETSPARPAQGHWETTERRWVETVPAVPAQWGWRAVEVSPGRWETVWIPPVTQSQWVEVVPSQWGWRTVEISPGRWESVWVPPVTQQQWVQISPAIPAQGHWQTVEISPGFWETTYEAIEDPPGSGYLRIVRVSRWVPPVTQQQWVETSPAVPAQYGWVTVTVSPGHWTSVWVPPVTQQQWVEIAPAQWGWRTVEVSPGSWESVWVPPVTETRWVETVPGVPAQGEWRYVVVATGSEPPPAQWRWVETAPAILPRPALFEWRNVEVVPGRWESVWMPPATQTRLVQVAPAIPPTYETRVVTVQPGRWEQVWIPPVTRTETVQISPAVPPVVSTQEVIVTPARTEVITIPAVTRIERVQIHPGRPEIWEDWRFPLPPVWRWFEYAPAIPPVYEYRTVVVTPAQTIPAVTDRRWVQTSPAVAGRAAQGRWETVVVRPATTVTHRVWTWDCPVLGSLGTGRWVYWTEPIPAVTETRWVETSPAVPARPAQGHWETVVISPARTIPAVTRTERVQVSPGRPAQGEWRLVPGGYEVRRTLVQTAWPPIYEEREVVVTPARTETVVVPAVTRTETIVLVPGVPARYETRETVITPGRWDSVWMPPVTRTETVQVSPGVPARYEERTETLPGRFENVWVPPVTEWRLVEVSPAVEGRPAQGFWELVTPDPSRTTRWVETSPAVPAEGRYEDVVVTPAITIPAVTRTETVWTQSGHWQTLAGTITVERDREFVLTHRWRPDYKAFDMALTLTYALNREVIGVQAVHILDRFQGMGQMVVHAASIMGGPRGHIIGFNYTHPGQPSSTVHIVLHFAGGETFRLELQVPVNGITVTQRRGVGPLDLQRAVARVGTLTIPAGAPNAPAPPPSGGGQPPPEEIPAPPPSGGGQPPPEEIPAPPPPSSGY